MTKKIQSGILLLSFAMYASVHLSIIPAMVAFEVTKHSNVAFWVYVASVPTVGLLMVFVLVSLTAYAVDRLGDDGGEWVTVETKQGKKKPIQVPTCTTGGKRDLELENYLYRSEADRVGG